MAVGAEPSGLQKMLGNHLMRLLVNHGVQASQQSGLVLVGTDSSRWARVITTRESESSPLRLHIDAAGPGGAVLSDSLNGLGAEADDALRDALQQFCLSDFHVLLAGLWGLLEEDQVDHYVVSAANGRWDLYLGAWVSRMSSVGHSLPAPEATFTRAFIEAAPKLLTERRARAGRVFVAALNGELTYEALFDMQPSDELEAVLRSVPLTPPMSGYASQRLFFLALPRDDGPAHACVGRCTPLSAPVVASLRPKRRLWIVLVVATISIAVAYLVLR